jgi:hypothetical protein
MRVCCPPLLSVRTQKANFRGDISACRPLVSLIVLHNVCFLCICSDTPSHTLLMSDLLALHQNRKVCLEARLLKSTPLEFLVLAVRVRNTFFATENLKTPSVDLVAHMHNVLSALEHVALPRVTPAPERQNISCSSCMGASSEVTSARSSSSSSSSSSSIDVDASDTALKCHCFWSVPVCVTIDETLPRSSKCSSSSSAATPYPFASSSCSSLSMSSSSSSSAASSSSSSSSSSAASSSSSSSSAAAAAAAAASVDSALFVRQRGAHVEVHVPRLYSQVTSEWAQYAPTPPCMESTTLYPYQQRALSWMIHREARSLSERLRLDENWQQFNFVQHLQLDDMTRFWFHRALGDTRMSEPPRMKDVSGGVLADSMGLGKTVEILALVCSHPCPAESCDPLPNPIEDPIALIEQNAGPMDITWDLFDFPDEKQKAASAARAAAAAVSAVSPKDLPALQCKTTLVICPTHILDQWLTEVHNVT